MDAQDGRRRAGQGVPVLEEGGHPDVRLGGVAENQSGWMNQRLSGSEGRPQGPALNLVRLV